MNVLILTPDRVGSTFLQRILTVYMLRQGFDKPVINLHELSNGLVSYWNEDLNRQVLGKPQGVEWGYYQTLNEVQELLDSADHYKTSRLAHYHLTRRNDSLADQIKFFDYLNKNFYIVSCRRENLFEHVISWIIFTHSKHLNVYSSDQKINAFESIYANGILADRLAVEKYLNQYVAYDNWVSTYFSVQRYFNYDTDIKDIEKWVFSLDFMQGKNNSWKDMFGQDFNSWNTCHRMLPNLTLSPATGDDVKLLSYPRHAISEEKWNALKGPDWPATYDQFVNNTQLPVKYRSEIEEIFDIVTVKTDPNQYDFLSANLASYNHTQSHLERLKDMGLLVTGIPIKLQSLQEKQTLIKNWNECIVWYNEWVEKNNYGKPVDYNSLRQQAVEEESILNQEVYPALAHTSTYSN